MRRTIFIIIVFAVSVSLLAGCGTLSKRKQIEELENEVSRLNRQIAKLQKERDAEIARLSTEKQQATAMISDLDRAKAELEERLKKEIGEYQARLEMTERGLVITFLAEVFFDSGKDIIRPDGMTALTQVAEVLNANVPDSPVAIEGHTDNEPIKYSRWKSNWELSCARSLAVLHYFIDQCQVKAGRLSAVGYGEYKSVASNDTAKEKQQNRRVEIVILPSQVKKIKTQR